MNNAFLKNFSSTHIKDQIPTKQRNKDIFFFLGLYLEMTGWKTERSEVMQRFEKLSKNQDLSVAEVVETLSKVSEEEFNRILKSVNRRKQVIDGQLPGSKGIEDKTDRKDSESK
ncbi:MAG: hypothetical protein ACXAEU_02390 [Candidatus Hodarchaeales archaeon]|jgi:hypothetical protein